MLHNFFVDHHQGEADQRSGCSQGGGKSVQEGGFSAVSGAPCGELVDGDVELAENWK